MLGEFYLPISYVIMFSVVAEARKLLEECMKILSYRDCRALNKIQIGTITADGAKISDPYVLSTKWDYKSFVQPKAGADTGGSW